MARQGRSNRRAYTRVSSSGDVVEQEEDQASVSLHDPLDPEAESLTLEPPPLVEEDDDDEKDFIAVVVLDPAQSKFNVKANPDWTVEEFKNRGVSVHKVPTASQRLIYHGKMLADDSTLRDNGIAADKVIVHLFPKPNVVVGGCDDEEEPDEDSTETGGAHVPRIVLDPDEAERRSQILVLASDEVFEAQHRVKLMCLLLLIMSSMELLQLFTIMMGGPEDSGDDDTPPGQPTDPTNHDQSQIRPWRTSDYFDLVINAVGFYVAMLGIRATTENTLQLAKVYLYGTIGVGVAWNAFYYYLNIRQLKEDEESKEEEVDMATNYSTAFFGMLLPILVWILCCLRAWQFHELLREAEREAEERTRNESDEEEQQGAGGVQHDHELVLQIEDENRQIT